MSSHDGKPRSGYDRWAPFYDHYPNAVVALDDIAFPPLWAHLHEKDVLEIGCGTGRHTRRLIAAGNRVTGIDSSKEMLAVAREKLQGKTLSLIEGDFVTYGNLGHGELFDAAVESLVLEHIPDLATFFGKVADLLKVGGELFLSEIHPNRAQAGKLAHFKDAGTGEEIYLDSHAHTETEITAAAQGAGFQLAARRDIIWDEALTAKNPAWAKYQNLPMIQVWVFAR